MTPTFELPPCETIQRRKINDKEFLGRRAATTDYSRLITEPVIIQEPGLVPRVTVVYLHLGKYGHDFSSLVHQLRDVEYRSLNRVGGTAAVGESLQRVFGYMPRKVGHRDYCTASSLATEGPEVHDALSEGAKTAADYYRLTNPRLFTRHEQQSKNRVAAEYHLSNTVFTSGIVNRNNPLPYHYDTGNFARVWSAMYVFKSPGYDGGYLSIPEYDVGFALPDHSLFMFDGQGLLHGVTPVLKAAQATYRYSVVYYSLRQMWQCMTTQEEVEHARNIKTRRERRRAGLEPNLPGEHSEEDGLLGGLDPEDDVGTVRIV